MITTLLRHQFLLILLTAFGLQASQPFALSRPIPIWTTSNWHHSNAIITAFYRVPTSLRGSSSSGGMNNNPIIKGIELQNVFFDSTSTAFDAWEWTNCLGAPAALVAGAVLVTLSETRQDMVPRKHDKNWIRIIKQLTRFLLLSSFALEVVSIFVSYMTGTVLLSHGESAVKAGYTLCPLGLLHHHFEFEYLTIQIGFLQGLMHWLGAVACEVVVPKKGETVSAKRMNGFMASCLVTLIFWIMAFYNNHLSFYGDYLSMLKRFTWLFVTKYFFGSKWRPMSVLYGPSTVVTAVLGWRAFQSKPDLDDD